MFSSEMGSALYYPYVNIRNENWLKSALLWLDRIYTIVPSDEEYRYAEANKSVRLVKEANIIRSMRPTIQHLDNVAQRFRLELNKRLEQGINDPSSPFHPNILKAEEYQLGYIFVNKIAQNLVEEFQKQGWVYRKQNMWMMHQSLSGLYMICLATEMSLDTKIPIVTDTPRLQKAGEILLYGQPNDPSITEYQDMNQILLHLGIPTPSIENIENIPLSKILDFHEKSKVERKKFVEYKHKIEQQLQERSLLGIKELLDYQEDEWKEAQKSYEEKIKEQDWKIILSPILISTIPYLIAGPIVDHTGIPQGLGLIPSAVGIGIHFTIEFVKLKIFPKPHYNDHPYHYLLDIQRQFPNTQVK